jgi:hypothetical protein
MELGRFKNVVDALRREGVRFGKGLSTDEIQEIESKYDFQFPADLKFFLQTALPISDKFPNWRDDPYEQIRERLDWPLEGMCFDIEHGSFWPQEWGPKPLNLGDAFAVARRAVKKAPNLIPIYSHRYMPDRPNASGNPVFSVHQTDIIYYGHDLLSYFKNEFKIDVSSADSPRPRLIEFRSDLVT